MCPALPSRGGFNYMVTVTLDDIRTQVCSVSLLEMATYVQIMLTELIHLCSRKLFAHVRQSDSLLAAFMQLW